MITGTLRAKVDRVWDAFWSGGISNPLEVIEQITYLLFIRRLDELATLAENKAHRTGKSVEGALFGPEQQLLRWSKFRDLAPQTMFDLVSEGVFPFLRRLGGDGSTYSHHMKDARFTIPTPQLLSRVVDMVGDLPMQDRDTNGDLYEYMLSKIASAGQNGQFRTPRHVIQLMVELTAPRPGDEICDPACGTAGFLVAASEYLRERRPSVLTDAAQRKHFHHSMFHGHDFDSTMLRIGSMNMLLHGVEGPDISYRDSLSEAGDSDASRYSLVLANPPFAGSLDYETTSKDLQKIVKTRKTELLFLAQFVRMLAPGGRAAVIVPDGVLFGSSTAHKTLRKALVEEQKLDAVVKLPSGAFRPYAGVSTAILVFTKTNSGGTDHVWFYDVRADGFSLDDKRNPVEADDLPDVIARWPERAAARTRTPPHRPELLRPQGRHRRPGLRPVPEPLPRGRPRRSRTPDAVCHHRRVADAGGRDRQRAGRVEGDAHVIVPLAEIAEVKLGRQRSPQNHSGDSMRPYLRAANVGWDGLRLDDVKEMNFTDSEMETFRLQRGDLLLSEASGSPGEVGKPALWSGEIANCAFQNTLLRVRPSRQVDARYLLHFFRHEAASGAFARGSRGVGLHHLGREALASWSVPLPPLDEQCRIAAILDQADALRTKRRQSLALLDDLTHSVFHEMFGDPLSGRWGLVELGQVVGKIDSGRSPNCEARPALTHEWGVLKLGAVTYGTFRPSENKAYLGEVASMVPNEVRVGDVLMTRKNTRDFVGAVAVVDRTRPQLLLPDLIFRLQLDRARLGARYFQAMMMSARMRPQVQGLSSGSSGSMPNISKARLATLKIGVPPLEVQHQFAARVERIDSQRAVVQCSLDALDEVFASLQARAFSGRL